MEKGGYGISIQKKFLNSEGQIIGLERTFKSIFDSMYEDGVLAVKMNKVNIEIKEHTTADGLIQYLDLDFYFDV